MRAILIPVILGVIAIPAIAFGRRGKSLTDDTKGGSVGMDQLRRRFRAAVVAGSPDDRWMRFLEQTAFRESRFKPRAFNKSKGEREAAARSAFRPNNVKKLAQLGYLPNQWDFGSKGLFQFLGPVAILEGGRDGMDDPDPGLRFSPEFIKARGGPDIAFDPGASVAIAFDYIKGLTRWKNFAGTWASLNVGWGNPSKMGNPDSMASGGAKMERRAEKLGWERGWMSEKISPVPDFTQAQLEALAVAARNAWESVG